MRRRATLVTASFVLFGTVFAHPSYSDDGDYHLIGRGTLSCGGWTADRRDPESPGANLDEQWALGFLSGVGFAGPDNPLNNMDAYGVWAWIDNYCQANPIKDISDATAAFSFAHPK
jgi:hypothetical protein